MPSRSHRVNAFTMLRLRNKMKALAVPCNLRYARL